MARSSPIQNSFVSGVISDRLEARDDLTQYFQSLRRALNSIILPHGGAMRRPGTKFISSTKSDGAAALIPFQFSTAQAYIVELGELYGRFFVNQGRLEVSGSPVEVTTPWPAGDVGAIQYAQLEDLMYIVSGNAWPRKLTRTTATSFSLDKVEFRDGEAPMLPKNQDDAKTLVLVSTTVTAAGHTPFDAARDVGRFIKVRTSAAGAVATFTFMRITVVTSTTVVTVELAPGAAGSLADFTARADWSLGAFSESVGPTCVAFHESRIIYGGGIEQNRIFVSVSDDFDNNNMGDRDSASGELIIPEPNADRSFSRIITNGQVNAIRWIKSTGGSLFIGTAGGEYKLQPANDDFLTPKGASAKNLTERGASLIQAVSLDGNIVFVQRGGQKLRRIAFSLQSDGFKASDVAILSENIFLTGAVRQAYQQTPDSVIWTLRGDGNLVGLTFEDEQTVLGYHPHNFSGGSVESIAVIPTPDEKEDQLWMIVNRTIGGTTKRYVEYMDKQFRPNVTSRSTTLELVNALKEAYFVDSGFHTTFGSPVTQLTGITHLAGETVQLLLDGAPHPDKVVSATGTVDLDRAATVVAVGLGYKSFGETQRFVGGAQLGTSQGQLTRAHHVALRLHATLGLRVGFGKDGENNLEEVLFRSGDDLMDSPPPLFFGDKDVPVDGGWSDEPTVYFEQVQPLPQTILGIMPRMRVNER